MERMFRVLSLQQDALLAYRLASEKARKKQQLHGGYGADCFHPNEKIAPTPGGCQAFAAEKVAVLTEQNRIRITPEERIAQWSIVQYIRQSLGWA